MLEKLSAMQMEGIVSKNVEAPYRSGRNESRLKIKCVQRAKFPIVGFVKDPAGLAALHLAKREWKDFVYVGKSRHALQSIIDTIREFGCAFRVHRAARNRWFADSLLEGTGFRTCMGLRLSAPGGAGGWTGSIPVSCGRAI